MESKKHINKQIFPAEIAEYSAELHFQQHSTNTLVVYQLIVGMVIILFLALFFIKVDVSVNSTGIIRPVAERQEIKSPVGGRVDSVFIAENKHVKAGQVLIKIKADMLQTQSALVETQQAELQNQKDDLEQLVKIGKKNSGQSPALKSSVYSQQYRVYRQKVYELQNEYTLASRNYERNLYLYNNHVLSASEFDKFRLDYQNAQNALNLVFEDQRSQWQIALTSLKLQLTQLNSQQTSFSQERDFYVLRSVVSGTIQDFKGVQAGGFVTANDVLATVSPDSGMIAETYVLPKDIGLIKVGTSANFQVDAFNYNEWGMLKGKIYSISSDVSTSNNQAYFKIRCKLNSNALYLKNGVRGDLKKGMSVQARFFVTRRSLYHLLRDKTEDWLNPNTPAVQQTASTQ
jgi:multidrug resistance efflux pump